MEVALKTELKQEISRIVDLMIQAESIRESIAELKKDIKTEYGIPVATVTKVATIVRKQNLDEEEENAILRVIRSGWVTQGPEVEAFERDFATKVGAKFAVAVSSCTSALHLGLKAVGVGINDEVIVPTHSFIASANAIRHCGAIPCFVDIDPKTFNLCPTQIESAINPKTKAIEIAAVENNFN